MASIEIIKGDLSIKCEDAAQAAELVRFLTGSTPLSDVELPRRRTGRKTKANGNGADHGSNGKTSIRDLICRAIEKDGSSPDWGSVAQEAYGAAGEAEVKRVKSSLYMLISKGRVKRLQNGEFRVA